MSAYSKRRPNGTPYYGNDRLHTGSYVPGEGRVSASRRLSIAKAYAAGEMSISEISNHFDVSGRTVERCAREHNIPLRQHNLVLTPDILAIAERMWIAGESSDAIKSFTGFGGRARSIGDRLRQFGLNLPRRFKRRRR